MWNSFDERQNEEDLKIERCLSLNIPSDLSENELRMMLSMACNHISDLEKRLCLAEQVTSLYKLNLGRINEKKSKILDLLSKQK